MNCRRSVTWYRPWNNGPASGVNQNKTQTPWPESARELYRPSDRRLLEKLMPTFARNELQLQFSCRWREVSKCRLDGRIASCYSRGCSQMDMCRRFGETHLPTSIWSASKANEEAALSSCTLKTELSLQVASQKLKRNDTPLPMSSAALVFTGQTVQPIPRGKPWY
jgi:hypothetical protein